MHVKERRADESLRPPRARARLRGSENLLGLFPAAVSAFPAAGRRSHTCESVTRVRRFVSTRLPHRASRVILERRSCAMPMNRCDRRGYGAQSESRAAYVASAGIAYTHTITLADRSRLASAPHLRLFIALPHPSSPSRTRQTRPSFVRRNRCPSGGSGGFERHATVWDSPIFRPSLTQHLDS